jgi:hypothetical protein
MEQCSFGLRGTVKDSVSGWPVEAEVYAILHEQDSSWVYSSLPNGNYHRLLPEGTYTIRYSAPGYDPKIVSGVSIINRQATEIDVLLVPEGVGGINKFTLNNLVTLYPNPVREGWIQIDSPFDITDLEILDLQGKELEGITFDKSSGHIYLPDSAEGIFLLLFEDKHGSMGMKKIILLK